MTSTPTPERAPLRPEQLKEGTFVWLAEHDNGTEVVPAQRAVVMCAPEPNGMLVVMCEPEDDHDDGLRELSVDQVERLLD